MRGDDNQQEGMFSYVSPEKRVPADHPLRPIRKMVDEILQDMSPRFAKLYSDVGRPSIAPERLFRSLLLQIFYSVRSERMLIEQLQYNLLFRWFVGMEMDEAVWNHAVYSKNRERDSRRFDVICPPLKFPYRSTRTAFPYVSFLYGPRQWRLGRFLFDSL